MNPEEPWKWSKTSLKESWEVINKFKEGGTSLDSLKKSEKKSLKQVTVKKEYLSESAKRFENVKETYT